jgi:hypothetical protein
VAADGAEVGSAARPPSTVATTQPSRSFRCPSPPPSKSIGSDERLDAAVERGRVDVEWSLPSRLLAAMDEEEDDRYVLYSATAPVPGLPEVRVSENLWQLR